MAEERPTPADKPPLTNASSTDAKSSTELSDSVLRLVRQIDLDKAVLEGGLPRRWEPDKWKRIKTLASAAAGEGVVELMTNQEDSDQKVAVKRVPTKLLRSSPAEFDAANPSSTERPWMDIAIVKHLNTLGFSCVCKLLGVFVGDEQSYIMTSFANRGDLFTWCQEDTSKAGVEREAVMRPMMLQMFAGICWLHNVGIAHRDLSCENVMLTDDGEDGLQVKIIDFGMASLSRIAIRVVRGKRSYQAPEMHTSPEYDSFLADIFAAGVIVYCMAVHYYPWEHTKIGKDRSFDFARTNGLQIFLQKKRMPCNKKPIAEVFSKAFVQLVCGLLSFEPESRYCLGEACFEGSSHQPISSQPWFTEV